MANYFEKPPFDYSPGLVEFLTHARFSFKSFLATLLRLEDKKIIEVDHAGDKITVLLKTRTPSDLSPSEFVVFNFLDDWTHANEKGFSLDEMRSALYGKYNEFWQKFENALIGEFHERKFTSIKQLVFVDELGKETLMKIYSSQFMLFWLCAFFGIPIVFFGSMIIALFASFDAAFFIVSMFMATFQLVFVYFFINHLLIGLARNFSIIEWECKRWFLLSLRLSFTQLAQEHREKWREFATFIKEYSEIEKEPLKYHELWDEFYTYALVAGAASE